MSNKDLPGQSCERSRSKSANASPTLGTWNMCGKSLHTCLGIAKAAMESDAGLNHLLACSCGHSTASDVGADLDDAEDSSFCSDSPQARWAPDDEGLNEGGIKGKALGYNDVRLSPGRLSTASTARCEAFLLSMCSSQRDVPSLHPLT